MNNYIYYYLLAVNILAFRYRQAEGPPQYVENSGEDSDLKRCHRWQCRSYLRYEIFSPQNTQGQICGRRTGDTACADRCGVSGAVGDEVERKNDD